MIECIDGQMNNEQGPASIIRINNQVLGKLMQVRQIDKRLIKMRIQNFQELFPKTIFLQIFLWLSLHHLKKISKPSKFLIKDFYHKTFQLRENINIYLNYILAGRKAWQDQQSVRKFCSRHPCSDTSYYYNQRC